MASTARDRLLARVLDYYAAHGVKDTSLRTLAAGIGTSQRMLNYHFGSREAVLAAIIDAVAGAQADHIHTLFADEPDVFVAAQRNWQATADGAYRYGALWFELAAHAMRGEVYADDLAEVMVAAQLRAFSAVYERYTTIDHASDLARLTLAVGQGLLFQLLIDHDRPGADAAVAEFTEMVRRALPSRTGQHEPD